MSDAMDEHSAGRARIVPTELLRRAYTRYDASLNPSAMNYVPLEG